jgi:SET domain-containing protein
MLINTSERIIFVLKNVMRINPPTKIYLDKSPIHGIGVFASEKIKIWEVIEICPIVDINLKDSDPSRILIDYRFNWPQGGNPEKQVVSGGYGMFYNHSEKASAAWRSNKENNTFEFYALREIEKGEEILVYYGSEEYWDMIKRVKEENR